MGEMSKQYKVLGLNPQSISVFYGVVLIVFSVLVSVLSESKSLTSYIPAFLGTPILTFGLVFTGTPITENRLSWANFSRLFMFFTGAAYVTICVQSFIFVRRQRELSNSGHV